MFNTLNTYEGIFRRLFSQHSKKWFSVAMLFTLVGCTSVPDGVKPVEGFELDRYLGQWYEVARYDHSFEEGLSNVTATYAMRDDGGVKVINRGYSQEEAKWDEAEGKGVTGTPSFFINGVAYNGSRDANGMSKQIDLELARIEGR